MIPALGMFPIVWVHVLLAKREERQMVAESGETYMSYASMVPASIPCRRRSQTGVA